MGTWLAVEVVVALLAAVLWGETVSSTSECDRDAVEVECEGEGGRGDRS